MMVVNKYRHTPTENDVYIGRGSKWGNPFRIGTHGTRADVIAQYEAWITKDPAWLSRNLPDLQGKNLVCFCAPQACHGDVLKRLCESLPAPLAIGRMA